MTPKCSDLMTVEIARPHVAMLRMVDASFKEAAAEVGRATWVGLVLPWEVRRLRQSACTNKQV